MAVGSVATVMAVFALVLLTATPAIAQTVTLTVSPTSTSFSDANPTTTPSITASPTVAVTVVVSGAAPTDTWSVNALADGDLLSGPDVIAISNVTWTTAGPTGPCTACSCHTGTASTATNQLMFNGQDNTAGATCTKTFFLANSWSYNTGAYSQTITITASIP